VSTVGSIGSAGSGLPLWLQRLAQEQNGQADSAAGNSPIGPTGATQDAATAAGVQGASDSDGDADGSGAGSAGSSGLQQKVLTAVQDAVKSFDSSGSLSDLLKTIRGTVDSTLQANGVTPGRGHHGHRHHGGTAGTAQGTDPTQGGAAAPGSNQTQATSLDELLSQNGMSADQVKQELISAIENPGSGQTSVGDIFAQIFQGLPKGSAVDVNA
jgi:hypothetical protein